MDVLDRARALAACPLFESLAPAVLIRLAESARAEVLAAGDTRSTDDTAWIVAAGTVAVGAARVAAGHALGMIRVVRPETPPLVLAAEHEPVALIGLAFDDVRDVLEEDPLALAALADRLAVHLLSAGTP
jgi:hypothetical protein